MKHQFQLYFEMNLQTTKPGRFSMLEKFGFILNDGIFIAHEENRAYIQVNMNLSINLFCLNIFS